MQHSRTIYELTSGGRDGRGIPPRYFGPGEHPDACVRAAELILELDRDDSVGGAWVHLRRLPDGIYRDGVHLLAWTKVSNERPTVEGATTPEAAGI